MPGSRNAGPLARRDANAQCLGKPQVPQGPSGPLFGATYPLGAMQMPPQDVYGGSDGGSPPPPGLGFCDPVGMQDLQCMGMAAMQPPAVITPAGAKPRTRWSAGGQVVRTGGNRRRQQRDEGGEERDGHRVQQREKQIMFGKVTVGYRNYVAVVPREDRQVGNEHHPTTPRVNQICSKRNWDCQVGVWRRALHLWDHGPTAEQMRLSDHVLAERQQQIRDGVKQPIPERHHFAMPPPREACEVFVGAQKADELQSPKQDGTSKTLLVKCVKADGADDNQGLGIDGHCKVVMIPARLSFAEFERIVEEKMGAVSGMFYRDRDGDLVDVDDSSSLQAFLAILESGVKPAPKLTVDVGGSSAPSAPAADARKLLRLTSSLMQPLPPATCQALRVLATRLPIESVAQVLQAFGSGHRSEGCAASAEVPPMPPLASAACFATPRKGQQQQADSTASTPMPDLVELSPSPCRGSSKDTVRQALARLAEYAQMQSPSASDHATPNLVKRGQPHESPSVLLAAAARAAAASLCEAPQACAERRQLALDDDGVPDEELAVSSATSASGGSCNGSPPPPPITAATPGMPDTPSPPV
eukprot:TRINITY_DN3528_c1_g1_i1.p1 TRINITY_DN3528_c1_g1~~TRINITY_DN3528_c1_g1_i1.p1  ORF type:complete len:637 (+),score=248.44 TRINITY_DN3528_c1_g1_i1:156-1913(+)